MNRSFSQSRDVQITVSLSKLISSKRNPRRVKPERDAHRRMVASIRAHGLLAPLVVRADDGNAGDFKVIAGNRRLAALREVYKDSAKPPKVLCVLRSVDDTPPMRWRWQKTLSAKPCTRWTKPSPLPIWLGKKRRA